MKYVIIVNGNKPMGKTFESYSEAFVEVEQMIKEDWVSESDEFKIYKLNEPAASATVSISLDWDEYDPE